MLSISNFNYANRTDITGCRERRHQRTIRSRCQYTADHAAEDQERVQGTLYAGHLPLAEDLTQESRADSRGDWQMVAGTVARGVRLQRDQGVPQSHHCPRRLGRAAAAHRRDRGLRLHTGYRGCAALHGGVLFTQHQQTPAPGTCAQQPAGACPLRSAACQRQAGGEDQHRKRSWYPHLQVDARLAEVGRGGDSRVVRQEGGSPDRRLLRAVRQAI